MTYDGMRSKHGRAGWLTRCLQLMALALTLTIGWSRSSAAKSNTMSVSFTVTNSLPFARPEEPLRCGLPLPRGFAQSIDELTVLGPDGKPRPVQLQVTSTYADQTPRWLLMDLQPSLPAADQIAYRLRFGDLYLTLSDRVTDDSLEQTCFSAEILFTCYLHAPPEHSNRERYFSRGQRLMDRAQKRWPGTYRPVKTLVMCFANTGAYFQALELKARETATRKAP